MTDAPLTEPAFFDWMRAQQDDKRLSQDMVDGANELLALMSPDDLQDVLMQVNGWSDSTAMQLSDTGIEMLNEFEGFRSNPYLDAVGVPTIGYGTTYYADRTAVTMRDNAVSEAQAHKIKQDVINMDFAPAVNLMFANEIESGAITQNMFDALLSLAYNIGIRGLKGSSVYRNIKAGKMRDAADSFLLWNKGRVRGVLKPLKGLTRRRRKERDLFLA